MLRQSKAAALACRMKKREPNLNWLPNACSSQLCKLSELFASQTDSLNPKNVSWPNVPKLSHGERQPAPDSQQNVQVSCDVENPRDTRRWLQRVVRRLDKIPKQPPL